MNIFKRLKNDERGIIDGDGIVLVFSIIFMWALALGFFVVGYASEAKANTEIAEQYVSDIVDAYGIELTESQVQKLLTGKSAIVTVDGKSLVVTQAALEPNKGIFGRELGTLVKPDVVMLMSDGEELKVADQGQAKE